ncbi:aldehyde dehydrogenase family protein [Bartonella sp. TP]|uniref:aldehyde dehydrogenase family protein n=1 Tax=Bartonella sp. TP TaxID=3057550 RepID=UPI0025B1520A|nr:aldehyde dehydrogenase family protein [Bartonella sp. TP]MDN5249537.1 aldehyde dehydrogenase family protein [Alphaproteobacteria bacterium]WJW80315.1 aldehyde dehydrogenase family protein [Bartonella sp. TP]
MQFFKEFYINGEWVLPTTPKDLEVINPSTEESFAIISNATTPDINKAVEAAKNAFTTWSASPASTRLDIVKKILELYEQRQESLAEALSKEMGAPIDFALHAQVASGARNIENFIHGFEDFKFTQALVKENSQSPAILAFDPIGVVCLITPWNWPLNQVTKKVIPALLAGCTMVLKPSEISPISAMLFAQICHDAGVPAGVFNMIHGVGPEIGSTLTSHKDIDMVSFTGSTRAGRQITQATAEGLKPVTLELGGKGANLIFADSDENAIERGIKRCFSNSGQSCNSPTRMLIDQSIYAQALEKAKAVAESIKLDVANKPGDHLGPVVSKLQFERIQQLIQAGIDEGAKLLIGGLGKPKGLEKGYFVRPTIFYDVHPDMRIFKEEIFGPVLCITPFSSETQAINLANDTIYGLTNYIQSSDAERCRRVALKLRSGMVEINGESLPPESFFGGVKQSGRAREGGKWGIKEFLDSKAITS